MIDRYFGITAAGSTVPRELRAGVTTFLTMSYVVLSLVGVRQAIVRAVSQHLVLSITAGIGIFLAFIGLKSAGLVIPSPATFVTLGSFASGSARA